MDEATFWTWLEGRVSRELAAADDRVARTLWCDGFLPERSSPDDGVVWVEPSRAEAVPVGAAHRVSMVLDVAVEPPHERWGKHGRVRRPRGAS